MSVITCDNKYHVVMTFPDNLFPFEPSESEEVRQGRLCRLFRAYCEDKVREAIVHREYGDTGNFHLDAILGFEKPVKSAKVKRAILSAFGVTQAKQLEMQAFEKKHCIKVNKVNWLPGIVRYNMKEGNKVFQKGFSTTWLTEQAEIGRKEAEVRQADKLKFVNDGNFYKLVSTYRVENSLEDQPLGVILKSMIRNGYSFVRVRNMKGQYMEWKTRVEGDDYAVDTWLSTFEIV